MNHLNLPHENRRLSRHTRLVIRSLVFLIPILWTIGTTDAKAGVIVRFEGETVGTQINGWSADRKFVVDFEVDNGSTTLANQEWLTEHINGATLRSGSYSTLGPVNFARDFRITTNASGQVTSASILVIQWNTMQDTLGQVSRARLNQNRFKATSGQGIDTTNATFLSLSDPTVVANWSVQPPTTGAVPEPTAAGFWLIALIGVSRIRTRGFRREGKYPRRVS